MSPREPIIREYAPGEILCRQGTGADRVFVLRSGTVRATVVPDKVLVEADDDRLRRGHEVAVYHELGIMIGVEGALAGQWSSTLIADDTVEAIDLPVNARGIMNTIQEKPELGIALARMLARRLLSANKALGSAQRQASRFLRDFQGMCVDFYNLVQRIGEDAAGEDEILQALNAAKRSWAYGVGEGGGAEVARNTRMLMSDAVQQRNVSGRQIKLGPGDYLCRKGETAGSVYLLISGRLSVRVGAEQFGQVRPGEMAGEIGVLLGQAEPRRTADIVADEPCLVGVIPNEKFIELVSSQPRLLINLCKVMAIRVKSFEQLAAESDDALRAISARFDGGRGSFVQDVSELKRRLTLLAEDSGVGMHAEVEQLEQLVERWRTRMDALNEELGARSS